MSILWLKSWIENCKFKKRPRIILYAFLFNSSSPPPNFLYQIKCCLSETREIFTWKIMCHLIGGSSVCISLLSESTLTIPRLSHKLIFQGKDLSSLYQCTGCPREKMSMGSTAKLRNDRKMFVKPKMYTPIYTSFKTITSFLEQEKKS